MTKSQKEYWEHHITNWEKSAYEGSRTGSFIEKVASYFRGHIVYRKNACKRVVLPYTKGKTALEIGCGSGTLLIEMAREGSPKKLIGWEISSEATRAGNEAIEKEGLQKVCRIECKDIDQSLAEISAYEIVYGLGILEYLEKNTVRELFKNLKDASFFFQYHRSYFSLKNILHVIYRTIKQIPIYNQYTRAEMIAVIEAAGIPTSEIQFMEDHGNDFVYRMVQK